MHPHQVLPMPASTVPHSSNFVLSYLLACSFYLHGKRNNQNDHQNSHQNHHVMAIHGYLQSAWLSHRALQVFIFRGILSPQTIKQNSRKLSTSDEGNAQHLVTLGGAIVISMNKQNENTQRKGKNMQCHQSFLLFFVVLNFNNLLAKFNSLVGRKWMSSPTVEGHPCSKVSKTNLHNIYKL